MSREARPVDLPPMGRRGRRPAWLRADVGLGRDNGLLFWASVLTGAGFNLQMALWALFAERLGASPGQIGLVLGGAAVARTLLAVPAGALADRVSPKPVIVGASLLAVPGALIFAVAGEWWHALLGAVLIECSAAAVPATSALLARAPTEQERTRAYTYVYNVAFGVSGIVAPAAGGWIADLAGFRAVFVVAAGFLLGGSLVCLGLPGGPPPRERRAVAAAPAGGYRALLATPAILVVLALHISVPLSLGIGTALQPNFLVEERGLRVGLIGTLGSVNALVGLGLSLAIAHWRRMPSAFAGLALCIALTATSFALLLASGALAVVTLAFALRAGFGALWPLLAASVASATPEHSRGRAYGLAEFVIGVADVLAPLTAGLLYGVSHSLPLWVALVSSFPVIVFALLIHRQRERIVFQQGEPRRAELLNAPTNGGDAP